MRVIIIDDSQPSVELIQTMLEEYFSNIQVVGVFTNPSEGLKKLEELSPDVIFLDIEMPELNGIEFLELMPENLDIEIVIISGKQDYAYEGIKHGVAYYLVKPISILSMNLCIQRLLTRINEKPASRKRNMIVVNRHDKLILLRTDQIVALKADGPYCEIITKSNETVASSKPIGYYDNLLPQNKFYKVHRSIVINTDFVTELLKEANGEGVIVLSNGMKIPISRMKRYEFTQYIK